MIKRFRIRYIIILGVLLLIGGVTYKKLVFRHDKKTVIEKLENYKRNNSAYPKNLSELDESFGKIFYYSTDSLRQSFTLSYASGIMNVNTNRYDSQTKKWTEIFNY